MSSFTKDWRLYFSIAFMMLVMLVGFTVAGEAERADRTLGSMERAQVRANRLELQVQNLQGQIRDLQSEIVQLTERVRAENEGTP